MTGKRLVDKIVLFPPLANPSELTSVNFSVLGTRKKKQ